MNNFDRIEERHAENKEARKVIFKKLVKLDELPCERHSERMKWHDRGIKVLWVAFIGVVLGGIVLGIWVKAVFSG